jgi:hypothetical protein
MLLRFIFAAFAGLAIVSSGIAKDAQIGAATLTLPPPDGFCEMTEDDPSDARMIQAISGMLASAQVEALVMSADCTQLESWRGGVKPLLDDFAQYQTAIPTKNSDFPRAESIKGFCTAMRAQGGNMAGMTDDLNKRLNAVLENAKFNEMNFLGVLAEDADACYFGLVQKVRSEIGTEKTQVGMTATTVIKGKLVNYVVYTTYQNADTVTEALARHKRNVAALLAANGG